MTVTNFLATVIGWYLIIMGLFLWLRKDILQKILQEMIEYQAILMVIGMLTVILGLVMVVSHNIWLMDWPVIITIFSWFVLITGLSRIFFTEFSINLGINFLNCPIGSRVLPVIFEILGGYLLFKVYF